MFSPRQACRDPIRRTPSFRGAEGKLKSSGSGHVCSQHTASLSSPSCSPRGFQAARVPHKRRVIALHFKKGLRLQSHFLMCQRPRAALATYVGPRQSCAWELPVGQMYFCVPPDTPGRSRQEEFVRPAGNSQQSPSRF